jgi:hypothetical protein
VVHRSQTIQRSFQVPFQFSLLGSQLTVSQTNPPMATVTLSGPRRNFTLLDPRDIKLLLNLEEAKPSQKTYRVNRTDIGIPGGLSLDDINPREVTLRILERTTAVSETNTLRTARPLSDDDE